MMYELMSAVACVHCVLRLHWAGWRGGEGEGSCAAKRGAGRGPFGRETDINTTGAVRKVSTDTSTNN